MNDKQTSAGRKRRRPHNAKANIDYDDIPELIRKLGAERMTVKVGLEVREMSRAEAGLRQMVERALAGNRRRLGATTHADDQASAYRGPRPGAGSILHVLLCLIGEDDEQQTHRRRVQTPAHRAPL